MKTIIWKGVLYQSLEHFKISNQSNGYKVSSTIIGSFEDKNYFVNYHLMIDKNWEVFQFSVNSEVNGATNSINGNKTDNRWQINEKLDERFDDIIYIDISLTPFTNTLPINHLKLDIGAKQKIEVIYMDILNAEIYPVEQYYSRQSHSEYLYENVDDDFEALLSVDAQGFVNTYPKLFDRLSNV